MRPEISVWFFRHLRHTEVAEVDDKAEENRYREYGGYSP